MELEADLLERARDWETLSRWERSELGRDLRRAGLSYGEMMELVPVKKSTLATWCRDVTLTPEQVDRIAQRRTPAPGRNLMGQPYTTQRSRRIEIEAIRAQAKLEAHHLSADAFWMAGVVLYWGEGTKTNRRLSVANSDPAALRLFKAWAEEFAKPNSGWRARLHLHADNDEPAARRWWAAQLEIPVSDFTQSFIKPDGTGHRKNHLPYGVCTLSKRKSTDAFLQTMGWIEFLQDRFGE
jgi:hypothetical protein